MHIGPAIYHICDKDALFAPFKCGWCKIHLKEYLGYEELVTVTGVYDGIIYLINV